MKNWIIKPWHKIKKIFFGAIFLIFANSFSFSGTICAKVKIQIRQELTLERQAFDAHMKITNGFPEIALENIGVEVLFEDGEGQAVVASSNPDHPSALFFIRVDQLENIQAVDGTGRVNPATEADIHWLIIPAQGAANENPAGELYYVGARLTYSLGGEAHSIEVTPDYIYVKPMPDLVLDYFLPVDVYGDNPLTPEVEPPLPFHLGVRVKNQGFGTARNVSIDSGQPKIIENDTGLLVAFEIIASQVNGQSVDPSLQLNFGNIPSQSSVMGTWSMIASLSGRFTEFYANFTHADELGGRLTSLIDQVNTHLLIHEVRVDLPGRDTLNDFLAFDGNFIYVYESDNQDTEVQDLSTTAQLSGSGNHWQLDVAPSTGFFYARLKDPTHGTRSVQSAVRSDGKRISSRNIWQSQTFDTETDQWEFFLSLFDVNAGDASYSLDFGNDIIVENQPPVFSSLGDRVVQEGQALTMHVQAIDPEGEPLIFTTSNLPIGAQFQQNQPNSGILTWTPTVGQKGVYPITFKAFDGVLISSEISNIQVTDEPVNNQRPVASDGHVVLNEDTQARQFLIARDQNGDSLTYQMTSNTTNGIAELLDATSGEFRYTPNENWHGQDAFTFIANDGVGASNEATIILNVNPINDPPISVSGSVWTQANQASAALKPTVVDPDIDDVHEISVVLQPQNGVVEVENNLLTYTPDQGFSGNDSFKIQAMDYSGYAVSGTIPVEVNSSQLDFVANNLVLDQNLNPTLANFSFSSGSDATQTVQAQLFLIHCDSVVSLATESIEAEPGQNQIEFLFDVTPHLTQGIATLVATIDSTNDFIETYEFNNSTSAEFTAEEPYVNDFGIAHTLTIQPNYCSAGQAVISGRSYFDSGPQSVCLSIPFSGRTIPYQIQNLSDASIWAQGEVLSDDLGAWSINATMPDDPNIELAIVLGEDQNWQADLSLVSCSPTVGMSPAPPYAGPNGSDAIIQIDDPTALEPWIVHPGMPIPTTESGPMGGTRGTGVSSSLVVNSPSLGASGQGQPVDMRIDELVITESLLNKGELVQGKVVITGSDSYFGLPIRLRLQDEHQNWFDVGSLTWLYINGEIEYAFYFSLLTPGDYIVQADFGSGYSDLDDTNNQAQVSIQINDNFMPIANDAQVSTQEDIAYSGQLEGQDRDSDPMVFELVTQGVLGQVTLSDPTTGDFLYQPNANVWGEDYFEFRIFDGTAYSKTAQVTVEIQSVNDVPVALGDVFTIEIDQELTGNVQGNDIENDPLTYTIVEPPTLGQVVLETDGQFTYTPNSGVSGADLFSFKVSDGENESPAAEVHITISSGNQIPVAENGVSILDEDEVYSGALTGSDPDGTQVTYAIETQTANGTLILSNANTGEFLYTPEANYFGQDQFSFTVTDGELTSQPAMMDLTINPVNDIPTVEDLIIIGNEDEMLSGLIVGADIEEETLTFELITQGSKGTGVLDASGSFTYTPNLNEVGEDTLLFRAFDGTDYSQQAEIRITLSPVNDAPTFTVASAVTNERTLSLAVTPEVSDPDSGDLHTFGLISDATHGRVKLIENQFLYWPLKGFLGQDVFRYSAQDQDGLVVEGDATIDVELPIGDLHATEISYDDSTKLVHLSVMNSFELLQEDVVIRLEKRSCGVSDLLVEQNVTLIPGSNALSLGPFEFTEPTLFSVFLDAEDHILERNERNNLLNGWAALSQEHQKEMGLTTQLDIHAQYCANGLTPITGRSFYVRKNETSLCVSEAVQSGQVVVELWDADLQSILVSDQTQTDVDGFWHTQLFLPNEIDQTFHIRLRVQAGDLDYESTYPIQTVDCDALVSQSIPFPAITQPIYQGPSQSQAFIMFDDQQTEMPWLVYPGMRIPTLDSGLFGHTEGTGLSTEIRLNSPMIGETGSGQSVEMGITSLQLSEANPIVGNRVILTGEIAGDDSIFGLPIEWVIHEPINGSTLLMPTQWYYVNGLMSSRIELPVWDTEGQPIQVELRLGSSFVDGDLSDNQRTIEFTPQKLQDCSDGEVEITIETPIPGSHIDIRYGAQDLVHGDLLVLTEGQAIQWRLNASGYNSEWKQYVPECQSPRLTVSDDDYCLMAISIPVGDGHIDLRYGPQDLVDGSQIYLPKGNTIQWRFVENGFNSGWKSTVIGANGCTLTVTGDDYCDTEIIIPIENAELDIRYGPQNLVNGDHVILPKGNTIQYRLNVNGFNSAWKPFVVGDSSCNLAITESDFCEVAITNPVPESKVDIRYGPQDLIDGEFVHLPQGITIQYRIEINGFNSNWKTFEVGNPECALQVVEEDYCSLQIDISNGEGLVDLRYGPQNLEHGQTVYLPKGVSVQWRYKVNGFNSAWKSFSVGENSCLLTVSDSDYCETVISTPIENSEVDIRYGPQNLINGDRVILPKGVTIQYRLHLNGFDSGWKQFQVGVSTCQIQITEDDYCSQEVLIPFDGGDVDIRYGPQNLLNGAQVFLPKGIEIQWRLSINSFNSVWKTQFVADPCEIEVSELDYCVSQIQIPDGDEIDIRYSVQNLLNGDTIILPVGNTIQWRHTSGGVTSVWNQLVVGVGDCSITVQ